MVKCSLIHISFLPIWLLSLPYRVFWNQLPNKPPEFKSYLRLLLGETQTKAAYTIGQNCQVHAQKAVGKKGSFVYSIHLCAWGWLPTPFTFWFGSCPLLTTTTVRAGQSLGRFLSTAEAEIQACLALSTNPELRDGAGAPDKGEFFANWYIQWGHQSLLHRGNFCNLPKDSLILDVLASGGTPVGCQLWLLLWLIFSWWNRYMLSQDKVFRQPEALFMEDFAFQESLPP